MGRHSFGMRRIANIPMAPTLAHWLFACMIVAVAGWYSGASNLWTSDAGALLSQGDALLAGGQWEIPPPLPEVDPSGEYFVVDKSFEGVGGGLVPLPERTAFTAVMGVVYAQLGYGGTLTVTLAGAMIAILGCGLAAETRHSGAGPWAVWLTVGTPAVMNSMALWGHSVAAALVALATWRLARFARSASLVDLAMAVCLIATASLARNEVAIVALAIALVAATQWLRYKAPGHLQTAIAFAGAAALTLWADQLFQIEVLGMANAVPRETPAHFDRIASGAFWTLLQAGARPWLWLATLFAVGTAITVRRRIVTPSLLLGTAAALCCLANVLAGPVGGNITGMLAASPALVLGLGLVTTSKDGGGDLNFLAVAGVYASGVLATQHDVGGSWNEWGWRYFSCGAPFLVAALVPTMRRYAADTRAVRVAMVMVMFGTLVNGYVGVDHAGRQRVAVAEVRSGVEASLDDLAAAGGEDVWSTYPHLGRWSWDLSSGYRWLNGARSPRGDEAVKGLIARGDPFLAISSQSGAFDESGDVELLRTLVAPNGGPMHFELVIPLSSK